MLVDRIPPPIDSNASLVEEKRIHEALIALGNQKMTQSELKSANLASFPHRKLKYLPTEYNGNVVFELP